MMREKTNETENADDKMRRNRVDLVFLHASPNLWKRSTNNKTVYDGLPPLDFRSEQKAIKDALRTSGKRVTFQAKVAT